MPPNDSVSSNDAARSMRIIGVREERKGMLTAPHIAPLSEYAAKIRMQGNGEVPDFDPLDGGVEALALFLFEKPGPMTSHSRQGYRAGSGFISRNNDDPTAEATFNFMRTAGIPRELTVIWNVIPWWDGTRKVSANQLSAGVGYVTQLTELLPKLRVVVFVGKKAAKARPYLAKTGLGLFSSDHPSPLVRARWPERWEAIPIDWARIKPFIDLQ